MDLHSNTAAVPYAEQYVGVWSILEGHANALLQQAKQVNIQLHLESTQEPAAQAAIQAQASTDLNVTRDGVAVIELQGSLMKHASSMAASRSMVAARRQVRQAVASEDVKGILLHIDSPGGTVAGTVDLGDEVAKAAKSKPVYAYVDDLCASAAYWIASQCTKVYSNRSAEIGSIGVFMAVTDWSALAGKEGAKVHVVKFGAFKGAGIAGTEITEDQLAEWQKSVDNYGAMFVDAVASGRNMPKVAAKALADGRIYGASDALDLKLIDGIQSLEATMAGLVSASSQPKPHRSKTMSTETDTPLAEQPATIAQLKKALPGSTAEFREELIEGKATLSEALQAHCISLSADLAEARTKIEALEAKLAEKPESTVRGNKIDEAGTAEASESDADPLATFNAEVEKELAKPNVKTRQQAVLNVNRRNPELRAAAVAAANS